MNTNRQALFARVGYTAILAEMLTIRIAEKSVGSVSPDLRELVESIPFAIEIAVTQGLNYATVASISEGADFLVPHLTDRYFAKSPRREWLCADAAFVYDFCQSGGLRVGLAPFEKRNVAFLKSAITIEWSDLSGFRPIGTSGKVPLLQIIRENRIEYPPTQDAEIRKRVVYVLDRAQAILDTIATAVEANKAEQFIYEESFSLESKPRHDAFEDIATLCELLGVETQIRPKYPPRKGGREIVYGENRRSIFAVNLDSL